MGVSPGRPLTTDHVRISFFQSLPNPLDLTIMVLICSGFSSVFCLLLRVVWESLSIINAVVYWRHKQTKLT